MGPVKILLARGSSGGSHNQSLLTIRVLDKTHIYHQTNEGLTLISRNVLIMYDYYIKV